MGSETTKQRMQIAGRSVILRTVMAFDECSDIDRVIVVSRPEEIEYMQTELSGIQKLERIVCGGATRAESSYRGICAVGDGCDFVAIHDAARCLITPDGISRVVRVAKDKGAATAAVAVTNTIKRVDEAGRVVETLDRSELLAVETPQVFGYAAIRAAFDAAPSLGTEITDDNMIYERSGGDIHTVGVGCDNFKITTPRDVLLAELVLKERNNV